MPKLKVKENFWKDLSTFIVVNIIKIAKKNNEKFENMLSSVLKKIKVTLFFFNF
jgi:hypothetical protein